MSAPRRYWAIPVAMTVLIAVGGGWLALRSPDASSSVPPATPPPTNAPERASLALPPSSLSKNPIATHAVARVRLAADLEVVGSVSYDQNRYAVVGPLISGRVAKLRAVVGQKVQAGQILAEIESSEVGQAQAAYLSAKARAGAAEANLRREQDLAAQRISSVREREVAEAQAVTERADSHAAIERLRALGLGAPDIARIDKGEGTGGRVPLRAPLGGTIIVRSVTLGQAVERSTDAFKIADLTKLWVLLDLYEKDLERVHVGQKAELRTEALGKEVLRGSVAHIDSVLDEKTRTAHVRVEFDNPAGKLRPGQFVTARLLGDARHATAPTLAVPRRSLQSVDGKSLVFVKNGAGAFERRMVEIGASGGDLIEIRTGVAEGDLVVTDGAFLLKSELLR